MISSPYESLAAMFGISVTAAVVLFIIIAAWETIWKAIAMWKAARNSQLVWFICIVIFNTMGILPILYILFFQKKKKKK